MFSLIEMTDLSLTVSDSSVTKNIVMMAKNADGTARRFVVNVSKLKGP